MKGRWQKRTLPSTPSPRAPTQASKYPSTPLNPKSPFSLTKQGGGPHLGAFRVESDGFDAVLGVLVVVDRLGVERVPELQPLLDGLVPRLNQVAARSVSGKGKCWAEWRGR